MAACSERFKQEIQYFSGRRVTDRRRRPRLRTEEFLLTPNIRIFLNLMFSIDTMSWKSCYMAGKSSMLAAIMLNPKGLFISAVIMLQGCSGAAVKEGRPANVTSNPSGAEVYANGEKLGVTPLHYELHKAFPAGWKNMMYQAQGVLMVKMDGCEDFTLQVNDYVLSNPIHADMVCSDEITPEVETTVSQEVKGPVGETITSPQNEIENRLNELEDLYERGVITREEYRETRERILNEI